MEWQCLTIRASVSHQTEVRYQLIVSSPSSERNNTVPCFYWAQNKQHGNSVRSTWYNRKKCPTHQENSACKVWMMSWSMECQVI